MMLKVKLILIILFCLSITSIGFTAVSQVSISRIDSLPNLPQPYEMRDWKQVALDYDEYVFNFTRTASSTVPFWQDYPLIWLDTTQFNYSWDGFGMPSYIGHPSMTGAAPHGHEAINCIAAVIGGTLCGIDKTNQWSQALGQYVDWAIMENQYFNVYTGENVALNYTVGDSGQTFWYDIYPSLLFCQLLALYPNTGNMESDMHTIADQWYNASYYMGGRASPWTVPAYLHTAFDFDTMSAIDNGIWTEPDAAAGIAWIEYMAYTKWNAPQHLLGARWGIEFLENRTQNPIYEILLPWGTLTAFRMNAELGFSYDTDKLLNWCFEPSTASDGRYGWGMIADSPWGGYDCDGLIGSVIDGGGYAFAMNTYDTVAALVPVVRYDQRYARAIGKWVLNAANASRLFYANSLDASLQSGKTWADTYDPNYCVSYEGLRKVGRKQYTATSDYSTTYGEILSGDYTKTVYRSDNRIQTLRESVLAGGKDALEHVWTLNLESNSSHRMFVNARYADSGDLDDGFDFQYATSPAGPFTTMFTVNNASSQLQQYTYNLPSSLTGTIYIKAKDRNRIGGNYLVDTLYVDNICVVSEAYETPYAMGDGVSGGWPSTGVMTDFATYGASHVGMLGAVVETTDVEGIIKINCLATDYYHDAAYPTYLLYNPYNVSKTVSIDAGNSCVDVYETITQKILSHNVNGLTSLSIPAESAIVVVFVPVKSDITISGNKKLFNGVIVDYRTNTSFSDCQEILASPDRIKADLNYDCVVNLTDLEILSSQWLQANTDCFEADLDGDLSVNIKDFSQFASDWDNVQ